jgi:hypothetical protein
LDILSGLLSDTDTFEADNTASIMSPGKSQNISSECLKNFENRNNLGSETIFKNLVEGTLCLNLVLLLLDFTSVK